MKKSFLIAVFMVTAITMNAQTEKGKWMFGGNSSVSFNSIKSTLEYDGEEIDDYSTTTTNVSFTPSANYFLIDNLSLGLGFTFSSSKIDYDGDDYKTNSFSIIPNATYFFKSESVVVPFIGAGAGFMSVSNGDEDIQKSSGLAIMARGGIAYFLNDFVALNFGVDFVTASLSNKEDSDYEDKSTGLGVGAGFSFFL